MKFSVIILALLLSSCKLDSKTVWRCEARNQSTVMTLTEEGSLIKTCNRQLKDSRSNILESTSFSGSCEWHLNNFAARYNCQVSYKE